jgi:hypothetical protein
MGGSGWRTGACPTGANFRCVDDWLLPSRSLRASATMTPSSSATPPIAPLDTTTFAPMGACPIPTVVVGVLGLVWASDWWTGACPIPTVVVGVLGLVWASDWWTGACPVPTAVVGVLGLVWASDWWTGACPIPTVVVGVLGLVWGSGWRTGTCPTGANFRCVDDWLLPSRPLRASATMTPSSSATPPIVPLDTTTFAPMGACPVPTVVSSVGASPSQTGACPVPTGSTLASWAFSLGRRGDVCLVPMGKLVTGSFGPVCSVWVARGSRTGECPVPTGSADESVGVNRLAHSRPSLPLTYRRDWACPCPPIGGNTERKVPCSYRASSGAAIARGGSNTCSIWYGLVVCVAGSQRDTIVCANLLRRCPRSTILYLPILSLQIQLYSAGITLSCCRRQVLVSQWPLPLLKHGNASRST